MNTKEKNSKWHRMVMIFNTIEYILELEKSDSEKIQLIRKEIQGYV